MELELTKQTVSTVVVAVGVGQVLAACVLGMGMKVDQVWRWCDWNRVWIRQCSW